jgi:hypothetical protein
MNDAGRTARLNAFTHSIVEKIPAARVIAYRDGLAGPDGSLDGDRIDGLHPEPERISDGMDGWLRDLLRNGYQDVVSSGAARGARDNVWSP